MGNPTQMFDTTVPGHAQIICALFTIKCYLVHITHGRYKQSKDDDVLSIVSLLMDSSVCTTAVCGIKLSQKGIKTIWCVFLQELEADRKIIYRKQC